MKRREFLKTAGFSLMGMAALCLGCGTSTATPANASSNAAAQQEAPAIPSLYEKKILIAYFSWSGNTKTVAEAIHKQTGGELLPIIPSNPYPASYNATLDRARKEQQSNARPAITTSLSDLSQYDIIFLGYPNWCGSYPMAIATFAEKFNWQGKVVAPFFTHGTGGVQLCQRDLTQLLPNASFTPYLAMYGSDVRNADKETAQWLRQLKL